MARQEFPRAVRVAVIKRATRDSAVYCEKCSGLAKRFQVDHVIADAIGGKPVIENAMLICEACWSEKNPKDTKLAAKTKRREAAHLGARAPSPRKIANRGFAPSDKPKREATQAHGLTGIGRQFGMESGK